MEVSKTDRYQSTGLISIHSPNGLLISWILTFVDYVLKTMLTVTSAVYNDLIVQGLTIYPTISDMLKNKLKDI